LTQVQITRRIEFDAGHRIPDHASKCRNIHGHRYVLEATVRGRVQPQRGKSDDGMVVDFSDLKTMMNVEIGDKWDHAFLVADSDATALDACAMMGTLHKTVIMSCIPTVENLAALAFDALDKRIRVTDVGSHFELHHVRLYETPNCWADVFQPEGEEA
jgi:6-pyruvoyltetrahydropterin/6-carboxytetrahydropterin synthase